MLTCLARKRLAVKDRIMLCTAAWLALCESEQGWFVNSAVAQHDPWRRRHLRLLVLRRIVPRGVGVPDEDIRKSFDTITSEELLAHVTYLASDELEGREAGTLGGQKAGDYLIEQVRAIGLEPAGPDGQFVQPCGGTMRNILAKISGADPQLAQETVVIGVHYDHLGGGRQQNAPQPTPSSTARTTTPVALPACWSWPKPSCALPTPPRRTILFAWWDGEEKGLQGSRYFVDHPTVPLEKIVFALSVDMIGRMESERFVFWGTGTAVGMRDMISQQNVIPNLEIEFRSFNLVQSDHQPFFLKKIPVLLPSTGLYPELHRPEDDVALLNGDGMRRATQLVCGIVRDLANRKENFPFVDQSLLEAENNPRREADRLLPGPDDVRIELGLAFRRTDANRTLCSSSRWPRTRRLPRRDCRPGTASVVWMANRPHCVSRRPGDGTPGPLPSLCSSNGTAGFWS